MDGEGGEGISTPVGHIPFPGGPFRHIVMDYVAMVKPVHGMRCMLVIVDSFSRWVEAVPTKAQNASIAFSLTREVIPRSFK